MIIQNIKDYGELLDNLKLLRVKDEGDYLVVKYGNKVFWDNLWDQHPLLKQARGHIFEKSTGNLVTRPFDKVFNYGENGAGLGIDPEDTVIAVEKVNGFLGVVTCLPNGERLYSTTGTLSSDYAHLVRKHCESLNWPHMGWASQSFTWLFEVCDQDDPHIIPEDLGVKLIGGISRATGGKLSEDYLDRLSLRMECQRPNWKNVKFKEILEEVKGCRHEGFMIRDPDTGEYLCKLKSPYYLFTKFLARLRKEDNLLSVWNNDQMIQSRFGEEFVDIFAKLRDTVSVDEFLGVPEQDRIEMIRRIVYEC